MCGGVKIEPALTWLSECSIPLLTRVRAELACVQEKQPATAMYQIHWFHLTDNFAQIQLLRRV